jgi:hypothetical protein
MLTKKTFKRLDSTFKHQKYQNIWFGKFLLKQSLNESNKDAHFITLFQETIG